MYNIIYLILLSAISFGGFFIQGVTGFGANLFTISFAILLFPRTLILPICLLFTSLQTLFIVYREHREINFRQFFTILALAALCGMPLGILTVNYLNETLLKALLVIFIFIYSGKELYKILKVKVKAEGGAKGNIVEYVLPILSGAFETAFGTGGPLIMAYLSRKIQSKNSLRATVSLYWTVLNSTILIWGLFIDKSLRLDPTLTLCVLPGVVLGQVISKIVSNRLSDQKFYIVLHSVLILSAVLITVQIIH